MSSSLLLILIVVLWLFVLAPLVVNTRKPIRRTSDALGKTRVLHRGGDELANTRRRPSFTEADVRVSEEVDESLETVDPQLDDEFDVSDVLIDDTEDDVADPAVVDGDIVYELEAAGSHVTEDGAEDVVDAEVVADADADAADAAATGSGIDAGAGVEADSAASGADAGAAEAAGVAGESEVSEVAGVADVISEDDGAVPNTGTTGGTTRADGAADEVSVDVRRQFVDADDMMFEAYAEEATEAEEAKADADAEIADAELDGEQEATDSASDADAADATESDAVEAEAAVDDTLTEDDYAFAEKRRGRGGFDPVSDAHYAQTRFARRRRSVAGLAAFILVTVVIAAFVGGWAWWVPLLGVGLMTIYLVYLRRTVRAEQELRARRIRRMKMARLGVRHREDEELGIPQRLRRPGAVVVELDEEDPDFADLSYTDVTFEDDEYEELPQARVS